MHSISPRDLGSVLVSVSGRSTSGLMKSATPRQGADPAALVGIGVRQMSGFFFRIHGADARLLRRRVLRNDLERIAQHRRIIGADRADIGTAAAAGNDSRPA